MLGLFIATEGKTQLMLMMLGLSVATPSVRLGCSFRCLRRKATAPADDVDAWAFS